MSKLSFVPVFFTLIFLYMFCSILCFSIEDHFDTNLSGIYYFTGDYWKCISYMFTSAIITICQSCFLRKSDIPQNRNKSLNVSVFAIAFIVAIHLSSILYQFLLEKAGYPELLAAIVNILGITLYLSWIKLEKMQIKFSRYFLILSTSIAAILSCSIYLANNYVPVNIIKTANIDYETREEVDRLSYILTIHPTVYKDTNEVINNIDKEKQKFLVSGRIKYKKLNDKEFSLSWEIKAPKEDYEKITKNRDLKYRFIPGGESYKQGINSKTFKISDNK